MNQDRRVARFNLSPEALKDALHMPAESEVYGVEWSFATNTICVYVSDPSLRPIPDRCTAPPVSLVLTEPEFPDGVIVGRWE